MGSNEILDYEPAEATEAPEPPALPVETGWKALDGLTKAAVITCTLVAATFIAPPIGFVFALASIGFSAGALVAARRDGRRNGTAFNTLIVSSLLLAILVLGTFVLFSGGPLEPATAGEPIPIPENAPSADVFVALDAIGRSGEREVAVVVEAANARPIDGTVVHVANAVSIFGTTGIYRWDGMLAFNAEGEPDRLSCISLIADRGRASTSCGGWDEQLDPNVDPNGVSWGENTETGRLTYDVSIWNASAEGVWMSVETGTGITIVSDIVGGIGYAEYDGKYGPPTRVSVYDTDHERLWYNNLG